ncbi:dihydrokaempferol 4-reductase [Aureococcus anophagefferens]|nr:dihydrokaempferol 4-reductase [Aureococcus anophagefferens]
MGGAPEHAAASLFARAYRKRCARRDLARAVQARFMKVYDANTGFYYFVDTRTRAVSWEPPKVLWNDERYRVASKRDGVDAVVVARGQAATRNHDARSWADKHKPKGVNLEAMKEEESDADGDSSSSGGDDDDGSDAPTTTGRARARRAWALPSPPIRRGRSERSRRSLSLTSSSMAKVDPGGPITERADVVELLDKVPLTKLEQDAPKQAMPGAAERLKFFGGCDLMVPGSYDASMAGCATVIHVASPFFMIGGKKKIREKLIDPRSGASSTARELLEDAERDAQLHGRARRLGGDVLEKELPYVYSKVLQEKRAEEIAAAQSQWTLVSLLIAGTFGPPCAADGAGVPVMFMKHTLKGLFFPACPPMGFPMHDIRDTAVYHTHAMLAPNAKGRYIPPMRYIWFMEWANALKDKKTNQFMLPFFHLPFFMKPVFAMMAPILGVDGGFAKRLWRTNVQWDFSRTGTSSSTASGSRPS